MKRTEEETDQIYASLKLIEYLFHVGQVKRHVFMNILNDYRDCIDISRFQCQNCNQKEEII